MHTLSLCISRVFLKWHVQCIISELIVPSSMLMYYRSLWMKSLKCYSFWLLLPDHCSLLKQMKSVGKMRCSQHYHISVQATCKAVLRVSVCVLAVNTRFAIFFLISFFFTHKLIPFLSSAGMLSVLTMDLSQLDAVCIISVFLCLFFVQPAAFQPT